MRLADFIVENIEPILQRWEDFAKTMTPAADCMDSVALRDHAEQMLRVIAADLRTAQSVKARITKSHGQAPESSETTAAETHADIRHASGFTIAQMIAEYRALRTSVLMLDAFGKGHARAAGGGHPALQRSHRPGAGRVGRQLHQRRRCHAQCLSRRAGA